MSNANSCQLERRAVRAGSPTLRVPEPTLAPGQALTYSGGIVMQ
ncbi:MAG: hypothetical protein O7B79_04575 [SAR324 cluster bacterium]|nr:hypothetical protein [SAR324 cluster bacterium]